ncbi:MAG TPA: extracellular solute-binding protein [Clostridia bacterium]|nr:extracellular solute-binding protein [Clostridia bacterium]
MKVKKFIAIMLVLALSLVVISGCTSDGKDAGGKSDKPIESGDKKDDTSETPSGEDIAEGMDTNNGRPYNLNPVKYDSRNDKYLNGINATKLPVTEDDVTLTVWTSFSSTIMQGFEEAEFIKELQERTGVKLEFLYPPIGNETENFNLRISSNDLPHIFAAPPEYAGGYHKAVDDGVYLELTEYYDKGLMPNIKWLRENNETINRDIVDDEGRMFYFPTIDIVPSHPWSGLWLRQDWLDELNLEQPKTIDDWDAMLRAMKDSKGIAPLSMNIKDWYGVNTNFMFVSSYEAGYSWINKNGKAVYGPIEPGFKDFLTKANEWYTEGLLDPDFATRDNDSYTANIASSNVGAAGLAYGEMGQIKLTGQNENPNFSWKPVLQPTSYEGQEIHLRQDNSTVRSYRQYLTTLVEEDGLAEIAVKFKDYSYSQDGGDLSSYGPEGVSYVWGDDGEVEWIYPRLDNDEGLDFWTIYPLFKMHEGGNLRDSTAYEFEPEVFECIDLWATQDASWVMPDNISHTQEESKELANLMADIDTLRDEMTLKFIMGQEPLSKFDDFIANLKALNIDRAIEIKNDALQRYLQR